MSKLLLKVSLAYLLFNDWCRCQGLPSYSESHNEFTIYQALEHSLLNDSTGELFRFRTAFFPSSSARNPFWKVDGLQTIQFNACLNITDVACQGTKAPKSVFANGISFARCRAYQWTNNYLLGLMATHQLYQFEPLLTSLTYEQTVGHRELVFNVKLSLNDSILCLIEEDNLEKYFTSFISWAKAYAAAQGRPTTWGPGDQGYVSRKYNVYTKGIMGDQLQVEINYAILACFIFSNILVAYLVTAFGGKLYHKASHMTDQSGGSIIKNSCRGVVYTAGCLLVPMYAVGLFVAHARGVYPKYYPPCSDSTIYNCEPSHSSFIYQLEVASFYSKVSIVVVVLFLYLLSAIFTVLKNSSSPLLFQRQSVYYRCTEIYFWWSALFGIHICVGLAGIPILMFIIITPIYTFFFIVSIVIIITFLASPVVICLQFFQHSRLVSVRVCRLINRMFVYVLITSCTVAFAYLYYCFMLGGASMNGAKGIIFSLIPPASVAIFGFYIRYWVFRKKQSQGEQAPTESDKMINNTEEA